MAGTLRGNNIHGGTFQFASHYPDLHMPAFQLADKDLVDPNNAKALLDGELVRVGEGTSDGGAAVVGSRRLFQILPANTDLVTVVGGAGNDTFNGYKDGSRDIDISTEFRLSHGRRGRGDSQFMGVKPVCLDYNFEFKYRLIDDNGTYAPGVKLFPYVIANGDLPYYVRSRTSRDVVGLIPEDILTALGDTNINGQQIPYLAVCVSSKDANGWIRAVLRPGIHTISGATD